MKKTIAAYRFLFVIFFSILFWRGGGNEAFAQQDAQFSQYMFNPMLVNPAYTGSREVLTIALTSRTQWVAIDGAPRTNSLSVQMPMRKKKAGLGFEMVGDKIGPKSVSGALFSYSYRIPVLKGKLSFGLRGGIYNYQIHLNEIGYKDPSDYSASAQEQRTVSTVDFGMYYYTKSFYWGFAATHLNHDKFAYWGGSDTATLKSVLASHLFMTIGKGFQVSDNLIFSPSIMTKVVQNAPANIDINCNFLIDEKIWLGLSVRTSGSLVFLTQFYASEKFRIGYSYDRGLKKIGILGKGSHEIYIGYDIHIFKAKVLSPRYL